MVAPTAIVAVSVARGRLAELEPLLLTLARSRAAGGLPVAHGALAVLVMAAEPSEALGIVRTLASDYPFHLRVEGETGDMLRLVRRAAPLPGPRRWTFRAPRCCWPIPAAPPRRAGPIGPWQH